MIFKKDEQYVLKHKTDNKVFYCIYDDFRYNKYHIFYNVDLFDKNYKFLSECDDLLLTEEQLLNYEMK